MFTQSEIQHDSMLLNVIYNLIAFVLGFGATITSLQKPVTQIFIELQTLTLPPDNVSFLVKSTIAGVISLFVKVSGDLIINHYKERKERKKNGKS